MVRYSVVFIFTLFDSDVNGYTDFSEDFSLITDASKRANDKIKKTDYFNKNYCKCIFYCILYYNDP